MACSLFFQLFSDMDWFPVVIALLVIFVVREIRLWWYSSIHSPYQTSSGNTNTEKVVSNEVARNQYELGLRPTTPNNKDTPDTPPLKTATASNDRDGLGMCFCAGLIDDLMCRNVSDNTPESGQTLVEAHRLFTNAHHFVLNQPVINLPDDKERGVFNFKPYKAVPNFVISFAMAGQIYYVRCRV